MIEIIYKESGEKGDAVIIKPPKNIRQIGMPRGRHKLYVEDYVYTFLHSAVFEGECQKRAAVLVGKSGVSQDIRYTFISGAVSCDDFVFQEDGILFDESCWEYIYKEIKQYFDGQEIVGWFLGLTGFPLELTPMVEAAHRKYFTGRDKVLFLSEPAEREDVFYAYEQGIQQRKEGYYIYYEKNLAMQEYMIASREQARDRKLETEDPFRIGSLSETKGGKRESWNDMAGKRDGWQSGAVTDSTTDRITGQSKAQQGENLTNNAAAQEAAAGPDATDQPLTENSAASVREAGDRVTAEEAIQNYRNMLLERKQASPSRKMSTFLYIAASAAMVILCVIGITTMNNYEKMKQLQETMAVFANFGEKDEDKDQQGVVVETVPGQVTPEDQQSGNTDGRSTDSQQPGGTEGQQPGGTEDQQPGGTEGQQPGGTASQPTDGQTGEASAIAKTYLDQGYYIVEPGDKLELICKKIYQTTAMMDQLCEANQIDNVDKIYAGQKLILP